jgi:hypothetical protein
LAAEYLYNLIEQAMQDRCEVCGRGGGDPAPVIRAATVVLDRSGLNPSITMKHVREPAVEESSPIEWVPNDRLQTMARWFEEARQAMERGEPRVMLPPGPDDVLDADVVSDTDASPSGTLVPFAGPAERPGGNS